MSYKIPNMTNNSWTPALSFGGLSTGITYNQQTGFYYVLPAVSGFNVVFFNGVIWVNNKGSATGNASITGFPLSSGSIGTNYFPIFQSGISTAGGAQIMGIINNTSTTANLFIYQNATGITNVTNTNFANGNAFYFSGFYFTN